MIKKQKYPPPPWHIVYFRRHRDDDRSRSVPGRDFLAILPTSNRAEMVAILRAVAEAPPPSYGGGGKWEAMKGDMSGYYQAKSDGWENGGRRHYRLFCLLDRRGQDVGLPGASVIVIAGLAKAYLTEFTDADYRRVRALGAEFLRRNPRSIAK